MNKKAVALLSGGLDSILSVKLMQEQGIEVFAVNYYIDFAACNARGGEGSAAKAARMLKVPFELIDITDEYLETFKHPKFGYGSNVNPCIDCKIFMLKKAKEYMKKVGASFLVTGEVVGQRPMSQRKDMLYLISKQAEVKEILLRPLSAKLLNPTLPETEGIINREELLDMSGRGRTRQMELAEKFGIKEYPNPAGGCLLTDPGFARRVKDLEKHGALDVNDLRLLKAGRHFRLTEAAKLVVGRDEKDNEELLSMASPEDIIFKLKDRQGPLSMLRGNHSEDVINRAAAIAAYHTKFRGEETLKIDHWKAGSSDRVTLTVKPADKSEVEALRI
ncbi:MAG: tRNA 4-thiouridine(8) synthase ThiI [Candidatus Omnitrophica bacterium]|nr:tRNA 4-thiouridine(8) synthase ThiI [Candidatus Omnitrophota bacterium]